MYKYELFCTENRAGPSNFGNVISQILLCKQITPDFNQEELCSIIKDTQEITKIVNDIQENLPQHENLNHLGKYIIFRSLKNLLKHSWKPDVIVFLHQALHLISKLQVIIFAYY